MQLLLAVQLLPAASPAWLPAAVRGAPDAPHLMLLLLWAEVTLPLPLGTLPPVTRIAQQAGGK